MSFFFPQLFSLILLLSLCFASFALGEATLQKDEVEALKEIGKRLGKKDWDFSVDPCSGRNKWISSNQSRGSENAVTCNCSFRNSTLCHVVSVDAQNFELSCDSCQSVGNISRRHEMPLNTSMEVEIFDV